MFIVSYISRICCRNSLTLYSCIVKSCFILFLCSNAAFFYYMCVRSESNCLKEGPCQKDEQSQKLFREKWGQALYLKELKNFERIGDEWRLVSPFKSTARMSNEELNCSSLDQVNDLKFIAAGWTKSTFKIHINKRNVSMKIINIEGRDMSVCMLEDDKYRYDCYLAAASKLLREISVLQKLSHANVIKVSLIKYGI